MIVIYLPVVMHLLYFEIGVIYLIKWPSESLAQAKHFHSWRRNSAQNKWEEIPFEYSIRYINYYTTF